MIEPQQIYPALPALVPFGLVIWLINKVMALEKDMNKSLKKDAAEEIFQRKDLCAQHVAEIKGDVKEIKGDVKELLRIGNGKKQ